MNVTFIMKHFFLLCIIILVSIDISFSEDSITIIEPYQDNSTIRSNVQKNNQMKHIKRDGRIKLHVSNFFPQILSSRKDGVKKTGSFKGRVMDISFFADHLVKVLVDSDVRPQQNVLNLAGKLKSLTSMSTFSMTVTDESYLIFVRDLENKRIYRAVGNTQNGTGEGVEYDMTTFPPMWDLPALVE